jgi:hypothetical protein
MEMKTPEEMAEQYADDSDELRGFFPWKQLKDSYIAGYKAGYEEAKKYWANQPKYDVETEDK